MVFRSGICSRKTGSLRVTSDLRGDEGTVRFEAGRGAAGDRRHRHRERDAPNRHATARENGEGADVEFGEPTASEASGGARAVALDQADGSVCRLDQRHRAIEDL